MAASDWQYMSRALELAERGRGHVEPNPLVGAVVVRDGVAIGEGWHQRYGEAHAEVLALAAAGEAARGAILYVTLEPCCHHGKTPPCTDAILRAGIRRVVAAMADPFPAVAGQGLPRLRAAGVQAECGLGEAKARRLNAPYLKLLATGRPYVHAKWAMTLDGKICTRTGDSKWISGQAARSRVHELRGRMDAIIIGIGTALADDPSLTVRPPGSRTPTRIVLDSRARLPLNSLLATTARIVPLLVVAAEGVAPQHVAALQGSGCQVVALPAAAGLPLVTGLLDELGRRRMTNILVEGGAGVLGSFLDAAAIDEVHVFIAPRLAGGAEAKTPIAGRGVEGIADALNLVEYRIEWVGEDVYVHGWR
jgi:diaminohydroxyphosphoribosylaminopyrimidine deaminase/5-amino-6-(5-phosphoribosylamino)uracil reductase